MQPQPTLSEARGWGRLRSSRSALSEADREVYHDRRVSAAPIHSVSSTRCGYTAALPRLLGRTKARLYNRLIINTLTT
ncbi:MAG: hypothetical protein ACI309_08285 [Candidatus Limisoma sp.]